MSGPHLGRGSKVETLPLPAWCQRGVWGTLSAWKSDRHAAITIDTGTTLLIQCNDAPVHKRFMLVDTWWTDEVVSGSKDIISIEFRSKGIEPNCFLAPAEDWLVNNFPQEPVRLDGKDWIILTEDDLAIATLANPRAGMVADARDAGAVYCPYIPLQMTVANPANKPVVFKTRYDISK